MVKLILLFFIALALGCSTTNHTNKTLQPFKFKNINISNNGYYSGRISTNETEEFCKTFVLKKSEIITFFKQSRAATSREYSHDLTASNCYVSGSFTTTEGVKGTWKIDRARRGYINLNNSGITKYYYCLKCKSKLFYEACDIECMNGQ